MDVQVLAYTCVGDDGPGAICEHFKGFRKCGLMTCNCRELYVAAIFDVSCHSLAFRQIPNLPTEAPALTIQLTTVQHWLEM